MTATARAPSPEPIRRGARLTRGRIADGVEHAREAGRDLILWCVEPVGFGCRIRASGAASYIFQYRVRGGADGPTRKLTFVMPSWFTPEAAGGVAGLAALAAALGVDPQRDKMAARRAPTIAELFELWRREEGPRLSRRTVVNAESHLRRQLKPFASRRIDEISKADVARRHAALADAPYAANRAMATLSTLYAFAARRDWISAAANPVKGLRRFREAHRKRMLSPEEIAALWGALIDLQREARHAFSAPAIMLGMLTGWRVGEVRTLEWADVDLVAYEATIVGKTGARRAPFPRSSRSLIHWLAETSPRFGKGAHRGRYVFPSTAGKRAEQGPLTDWEHQRSWAKAVAASGVTDVRRHDLRHLIAGLVGAQTGSALRVKEALGHRSVAMSERYVAPISELQRRSTDQAAALVLAFAEGEAARAPLEIGDAREPAPEKERA